MPALHAVASIGVMPTRSRVDTVVSAVTVSKSGRREHREGSTAIVPVMLNVTAGAGQPGAVATSSGPKSALSTLSVTSVTTSPPGHVAERSRGAWRTPPVHVRLGGHAATLYRCVTGESSGAEKKPAGTLMGEPEP